MGQSNQEILKHHEKTHVVVQASGGETRPLKYAHGTTANHCHSQKVHRRGDQYGKARRVESSNRAIVTPNDPT